MGYADIWTHANDVAFQGRCLAAMWDISNKILNDDPSFPAAGQEAATPNDDDVFARRVLRDEVSITPRQVAQQALRNVTIAASPATSTDNDIQFQLNSVWAEIRGIG